MSHLIELADDVDPDRKRFKETGLDKLIEDVEAIPLRYKEEILDGEDLIQRYMDIDSDPKNENPALHNQAVHKLRPSSPGNSLLIIAPISHQYRSLFGPVYLITLKQPLTIAILSSLVRLLHLLSTYLTSTSWCFFLY